MAYAKSFRDLVVYQLVVEAEVIVFRLSRRFPPEERFSLTDQIRRSSRSVGGQIAEAWGKRRYEAHFVSKLTDADAEQLETQHWTDCAWRCEYITDAEHHDVMERLLAIGRMLNQMMAKSAAFCQEDTRAVHEAAAEYFAGPAQP